MRKLLLASLATAAFTLSGCTDTKHECLGGLTDCSGVCVTVATDRANCGACGTVCASDQICAASACQAWETVSVPSSYGLPDFVPAGSAVIYSAYDASVEEYTIADDAWAEVANSLSLPGSYAYPAWMGDNLYWLSGGSLYTYSIADKTAASAVVDTMPASSDAQTTGDDSGNLYTMATDGSIIQYNPTTAALHVFDGPTDLPSNGEEPRLAWDSKTQLLYVGDYSSTPFYSLDPADGTLTPLQTFPITNGLNDAFCSDRRGLIYTSDDCGNGGLMMAFDTADGVWKLMPALPFEIGCSGTCTVTGDGYLYVYGDGNMARIKVF